MVSLTGTSQLIAIPIIPYVFVTRENLFKEISNERCPFNTAYAKTTPCMFHLHNLNLMTLIDNSEITSGKYFLF